MRVRERASLHRRGEDRATHKGGCAQVRFRTYKEGVVPTVRWGCARSVSARPAPRGPTTTSASSARGSPRSDKEAPAQESIRPLHPIADGNAGEGNGARAVHNPKAPPPLLRVGTAAAAATQDGMWFTSPSVSLLKDAPTRQNPVNQDIRALVKNRRSLQAPPPPQNTLLSHFALSPDTVGEGCPLFRCYGFYPSAHFAASCTRVRQCRKGGEEGAGTGEQGWGGNREEKIYNS